MSNITGSYGIVLTPFGKNGKVDFEEYERQIDILCNSDTKGLVTSGSTGEFVYLTQEENFSLLERAVKISNGRKPIIAGATATDKDGVCAYLKHASNYGVENALIAPPFYFKLSDKEVVSFYKEIGKSDINVNVIAYNIPFFTSGISLSAYEELLTLKHVVGLKNSGQNIKEIAHQVQLKNQYRPDFSVLTGTDDALVPSLISGCVGNFTAFGAIVPNWINNIYTNFNNKNIKKAMDMQMAMLPILRLCDSLPFPIGYKLFAEVLGFKNYYYKQSIPEDMLNSFDELREKLLIEYKKCEEIMR